MRLGAGAIASFLGNCECPECERRRRGGVIESEIDDEEFRLWDVTVGDGLEDEPMTLHIGAKLVKIDPNTGEPVKGEAYYEFEVVDFSGHVTDHKYVNESTDPDKPTSNSVAFVKLRMLR